MSEKSKVRFYHKVGGRKAFISLLLFVVSLILYVSQGLGLDLSIDFATLVDFWKWIAGIFAVGNMGSKTATTLARVFESKAKSS